MNTTRNGEDPAGGPDPARFFRPLARENPPEEFWTGFWPSVRAGIRDAEMRRPWLLTRGRALLVGSSAGLMAAAALLIAVTLVVPLSKGPGRSDAVSARGPAGKPSPVAPREVPTPPILEDLQSSSARVYTFHVGEPADSTDVILIVDESLDI
jgi:hypothetical protein